MAIEPIGSMMTIQAQPVQRVTESSGSSSSQTATAKPDDEFVSSKSAEVPQVDSKTLAINNVAESQEDEESTSSEQSSNSDFIEKNNERVKKAVSELNKNMTNSIAQFGIHEGTNRITIKIVDKETKEVIKELPPEKTLDMIAKAWELAGIMVDERR